MSCNHGLFGTSCVKGQEVYRKLVIYAQWLYMAIDYVYSHHARLHHFNHIAKLIQLNVSKEPDTRNPARTLSTIMDKRRSFSS